MAAKGVTTLTIVDSGERFSFLPYVGNSLVIVKAPIQHKVNPVLSPIIPRISVQIFMK